MVLLCFACKGHATTKTWVGAFLGLGNGVWNTAGNWSPASVPTSSDDVVINELALGYTISLTGSANAKSITINSAIGLIGGVTISTGGNTLTVASSLNVGAFSLLLPTSLTFTGSGIVTLNNAVNLYAASNLTFNSGTSIAIVGATVTGNNNATLTNAGTITTSASSVINLSGSSSTVANSGTLNGNSLTVNLTGTNCTITNTGNFNLGPGSIIYPTSTSASVANVSPGVFTLQSDATGSAAIGPIISSTPVFSGIYNVQRFLEGGSTFSGGRWVYRNYRLISSPVNAGLVSGNYRYTINYMAANAIVTGAKSSFGTIGGNTTIFLFSEDYTPSNVTFTSGNFKGVTDIGNLSSPYALSITNNGSTQALSVGNGFMFFFRGDNIHCVGTSPGKTTYPFVAPESVVFTASGSLNQNSYNVNNWYNSSNLLYTTVTSPLPGNAAVRGINLVGNPYACTIDWNTINTGGITATNVNPTIWVFDPVNNQYDTYSSSSLMGNPVSFTGLIASGQGFFVQANNINPLATPALVFNETAKSPTSQLTSTNLLMGTPVAQGTGKQLLRLRLSIDSLNYDDIAIGFNSNSSPKYNITEDSRYLEGIGAAEGLSSLSADSVQLAINVLPLPKLTPQAINLDVEAANSGELTFRKTALNAIPELYEIWLMDKYKKDSLDMRSNSNYVFNIDKGDSASFGKNRFRLVIRQNPALAVRLLDFNAQKNNAGVQTTWKVENEQNYTDFTVERSRDNGATFDVLNGTLSSGQGTYSFFDKNPDALVNIYRLKIEDLNGAITYSKPVTIIYTDGRNTITNNQINVYPNPVTNSINLLSAQFSAASNLPTHQTIALPTLNIPVNGTQSYNIKITNITGLLVKTAKSSTIEWHGNIGDLQPGTYIIQVWNNKDNSLIGKTTFIKL